MTYIIIINDGNGAAHLLFALQICCAPFSTGLDSGKYKEERRKDKRGRRSVGEHPGIVMGSHSHLK